MIIDTSGEISENNEWKYQGTALDNKLGIVSFRTNSKRQYYKLKNGEYKEIKMISTTTIYKKEETK